MLAMVLEKTKPLWDTVINHIKTTYKDPIEEWKFYGTKSGWTLAVLSGKRRLINLMPLNGCFRTFFTLSEKATHIVRTSANLPEAVRQSIPDNKGCVCGYGLVLDVCTKADVENVKVLLEIKDKN